MRTGRLITQSEKETLVKKIKGRMGNFERRTLGGSCPTPGLRIRSKGRGRGLARGRGRGPLGVPFWNK